MKKHLLRRTFDEINYRINGEYNPWGGVQEFLSQVIEKRVFHHETLKFEGVSYTITVKELNPIYDKSFKTYDRSVTIEGILLPNFPRNITASLFVNDIFKKMVLDYVGWKIIGFGKDILFRTNGNIQNPVYPADSYETAKIKAEATIHAYNEHKEKLENLLNIVDYEYPINDEEESALIRRLQIPINFTAYRSDTSSYIFKNHPYSRIILAEKSPIFDSEPMGWFVKIAEEVLKDECKLVKVIKYQYFGDINEALTPDYWREQIIQNLRFIEYLKLGSIDWNKLDTLFPKAKSINLDISEESKELESMQWVMFYGPVSDYLDSN